MVGVFFAYLSTAKLGQMLFIWGQTSPAVIWPPVGIALAAVLLGGYRMWVPVALAQCIFAITTPGTTPLWVAISILGYTLQPIIAAWVLNYIGFDKELNRTRDALLLMGAGLFSPTIAPALTTIAALADHILTTSAWDNWSRAWAGGVLSIMVLTPLILLWFPVPRIRLSRNELSEAAAGLLAVGIATYLVFWTALPQINVFVILYLLFAAFFWVGLRMRPPIMALSLFITAALGMAGSVVAHPSHTTPISTQLFADELFIILMAPIFFILSSLVEERRSANRHLRGHVGRLEEALTTIKMQDEAKSNFIAVLAHELRNPLAPLRSNLELLKLRAREPGVQEMIHGMEGQVHTMGRLLDDLLDIARVSQRSFKLHTGLFELRPLVDKSIETVRSLYDNRHHSLVLSIPKDPVWLSVDDIRFEQILINLLNNAGKYTDPGGRIELSAHREGDSLLLTVRDNGRGISAEDLPHIFEPFRHVAKEKRVFTAGLGIGLSLTKELVELHGGSITCESAGLGKGAAFSVRIPVASAPEASPSRARAPMVESSYTILIVDDNAAAAQGLSQLLEHQGHRVMVAYSGEEALSAARASAPNVIVLDIGLPDIDGYEVARRLRRNGASASLIALTGYGQIEDKRRASDAGFDHHLTKPVGIKEIEAALRRLSPSRA